MLSAIGCVSLVVGATVGVYWEDCVATWGDFGAILGHVGAILGSLWEVLGGTQAHLGV